MIFFKFFQGFCRVFAAVSFRLLAEENCPQRKEHCHHHQRDQRHGVIGAAGSIAEQAHNALQGHTHRHQPKQRHHGDAHSLPHQHEGGCHQSHQHQHEAHQAGKALFAPSVQMHQTDPHPQIDNTGEDRHRHGISGVRCRAVRHQRRNEPEAETVSHIVPDVAHGHGDASFLPFRVL